MKWCLVCFWSCRVHCTKQLIASQQCSVIFWPECHSFPSCPNILMTTINNALFLCKLCSKASKFQHSSLFMLEAEISPNNGCLSQIDDGFCYGIGFHGKPLHPRPVHPIQGDVVIFFECCWLKAWWMVDLRKKMETNEIPKPESEYEKPYNIIETAN